MNSLLVVGDAVHQGDGAACVVDDLLHVEQIGGQIGRRARLQTGVLLGAVLLILCTLKNEHAHKPLNTTPQQIRVQTTPFAHAHRLRDGEQQDERLHRLRDPVEHLRLQADHVGHRPVAGHAQTLDVLGQHLTYGNNTEFKKGD